MDIKSLTEQLQSVIEGDVISFADRKAARDAALTQELFRRDIENKYGRHLDRETQDIETQKETDKTGLAHIQSVIFTDAEGPTDDSRFPLKKELSYEEAQAIIFEQDYAFRTSINGLKYGGYDKLYYLAKILKDGEEINYRGKMGIGDGNYGADCVDIRYFIKHDLGLKVDNAPVPYKIEEYEQKYGTAEMNLDNYLAKNTVKLPKDKDYSTKTPETIEIGDKFIISDYNDYYNKSFYTFFEVVRRTKSSVWLKQLKKQSIEVPVKAKSSKSLRLEKETYVIPTKVEDTDTRYRYGLDLSKPFRIKTTYSGEIVLCQGSERAYPWHGDALKESLENSFAKLNNCLLEAIGHDFYGPKVLPDKDEGTFRLYYNGGNGVSEYLKKARNGRFVWKDVHNFDYANGEKPFETTDYQQALKLMDIYGGEVQKQEEAKNEALRGVRVHYKGEDGKEDSYETEINGSDDEIKKYFAKGSKFNLGSGENDYMAEITDVEILEDMNEGFTTWVLLLDGKAIQYGSKASLQSAYKQFSQADKDVELVKVKTDFNRQDIGTMSNKVLLDRLRKSQRLNEAVAERTQGVDVKEGDILYYSWGYDMTIPQFFKVVKRLPSSIRIEELEIEKRADNDASGNAVPTDKVKEGSEYNGKLCKIFKPKKGYENLYQDVVCRMPYGFAYLWDGKPKGYTDFD